MPDFTFQLMILSWLCNIFITVSILSNFKILFLTWSVGPFCLGGFSFLVIFSLFILFSSQGVGRLGGTWVLLLLVVAVYLLSNSLDAPSVLSCVVMSVLSPFPFATFLLLHIDGIFEQIDCLEEHLAMEFLLKPGYIGTEKKSIYAPNGGDRVEEFSSWIEMVERTPLLVKNKRRVPCKL